MTKSNRLNGFLGKALKNKSNIVEVRGPYAARPITEQLSKIADFVEGSQAEIILNSYIYVSDSAISVSGQGSEERLVLHPGYYYFGDDVIDTVDTVAKTSIFPRDTTKRFAQLQSGAEAIGWFMVLTATDRTQGYAKITYSVNGVAASREVQVGPDRDPVVVFVPGRDHNTGENKNYATTGTGTQADPLITVCDTGQLLNATKAVFLPQIFGAGQLTIEYQDVQIEAENIPATSPYMRQFFGL